MCPIPPSQFESREYLILMPQLLHRHCCRCMTSYLVVLGMALLTSQSSYIESPLFVPVFVPVVVRCFHRK